MSIEIGKFESWANDAIATGKNGGKTTAMISSKREGLFQVLPSQQPVTNNNLISGTQEYKNANWNARKAILDMIRAQLHYTADTPIDQFASGVKDAMKMGFFKRLFFSGDWEQANGRPLTARRIKAIVNAVKAEKAERAVTNLIKIGADVANVVNNDHNLKQALRSNPEGAAQLCTVLSANDDAKTAFVNNSDFRDSIMNQMKDGCAYPLPIGNFTFASTGKASEFDGLKASVNQLFESARENSKNEEQYKGMLHQCLVDCRPANGYSIFVNGTEFILHKGISDTDDEIKKLNQLERNMGELLGKLHIPNTKIARMQLMELVSQGGMSMTTQSPAQCKRFSFPKTLGLKPKRNTAGDSDGKLNKVEFKVSGNKLKNCKVSCESLVSTLGTDENNIYYDSKKSTYSTAVDIKLTSDEEGKLSATRVGASADQPDTMFNLVLSSDMYM